MTSRLRASSYVGKTINNDEKQFLSRNQPLQIIPAQVVFKDIQINQFYEITVQIRNLTSKATRIRFLKSQNQKIQAIYTMQAEIAPGLSMTAKIKYECNELKNQTEILKIVNEEGFTVQLPVRVYKMQSQILFEPFVNMGFLKLGKQHTEIIAIKNSGKAPGTVQFAHNHGNNLSVQPKTLKIAPKQQSKIIVKYKSTEAGLFKGTINLKSDSILVKDHIDIHATIVDHARFIVDNKGQQNSSFDFGTIFAGEQTKIKTFIVNNSPNVMKFKTLFRKGCLVSPQQFAMVQTPSEIGLQQSERVMFCTPQIGQIQPFSQLQFELICRTKLSYRDKIYTNAFALTSIEQQAAINHKKSSNDFKPENIYDYSFILSTEDDEPIICQLKATTICPQIKISCNVFKFGDCSCFQSLTEKFSISNKNPSNKVEISFPKIPNFSIKPSNCIIKPGQIEDFELIFQPKSIGKVDTDQLVIINKLYQLKLRCFGIATTANLKRQSNSFNRPKAFSLHTTENNFKKVPIADIDQEGMRMKLSSLYEHKQKYNKYLIDRRTQRSEKQKEVVVKKKWNLYQTKLKDMGKGQQIVDDEGLPANPPIDYQFQTGMIDTKIKQQNISVPEATQKLYVTRHIGQHQPPISKVRSEKYQPNLMQAPRRILPDAPQNYNHRREISQQLTPNELEQIEVGANTINFGQVYIKSKCPRYFWVRNSTKKAISIRLVFKDIQLDHSFKKAQVIQSGHQAAFEIIFCKDTLGDFRGSIKYLINEIHQFQMTVTGKCVPVNIQVDKTTVKFNFEDSSLQMNRTQCIVLHNPGNSDAFFKFTLGKQKHFIPDIMEGTLKPKQHLTVPINFTVPVPIAQKNEYNYSQRIIMKVLDGSQCVILCSFGIFNPKFTVKAPTLTNLSICLGHTIQDYIQIKNNSKHPLVIHITGKILQINQKARLVGDQTRKFKTKFSAKTPGKFEGIINIQPRGGKSKQITCELNIVQPIINFSTENLNLGVIMVQGVPGFSLFQAINPTNIQLPLIIDMRPSNIAMNNPLYIEDAQIKLLNQNVQLEVIAPPPKPDPTFQVQGGQNLVGQQVDENQLQGSQSDEEKIEQKNQDQYRRYKLIMKPQVQYQFSLEFFPKIAGNFQIPIPLSIEGSDSPINSPVISCEAIKPQFLFEPNIIDFKKKIITRPDRCYPKYITVTVSNLDQQEVAWQLKDQQLKKEGLLAFQQNKGLLKPNEKKQFRISYNPYAVGEVSHRLPLFIQSNKLPNPVKCADVIVKGQACLPRLYFNKREVILPVVPLNVQTTSSFRIINDGYENTNLKCQFVDDVAGINVKVLFPQGQNIGITRQKLKIQLCWKYHKPMSFCLKLEFVDDLNRSFTIPISGTADNCIFTNYTYFLRNQNKYTIKAKPHLELIESAETQTGTLVRKNSARSLRSNVTGKSVMSYLGVAPINPAILSNTIDYINRYLNSNLLTVSITQFPNSFIEHDGHQLFEIISFLSSKNTNYPWKYSLVQNEKPLTRATRLFTQYNQLIKLLKMQGAHLNHIRPEYLLSHFDLNTYLANLPEQKAAFLMPSLLKINTGLYNYLSMEAWITLLYQILKIYVLGRVTQKNFKAHLSITPQIPKYYLQGSNFSSTHENILFYWVQQAILEILLEQRRLTNFDKDFKDGIAIAVLLQKYASINILKKMKMVCTLDEDYKDNANVVCQGLAQIGLQSHILPKDIYNPLQRQMLLLILHLYVYLPFYTPKQQPIIFKCILGQEVVRSIQLSNPSSKPVTYMVRYEGSEDFILMGEKQFRIEPKQVFKFQVKFISRISQPVKGRIMFINVKQNTLTAAALVFELKSQIVGRISDRIWNVSGILYEQVQFNIEVANKFLNAEMVDFAITYQTEYIYDKQKKGAHGHASLPKSQQVQVIHGKQENIKIRKNGNANLILSYVPMSLYTTKTTILFVNPIVGEFQHQIVATVEHPPVISQIRPPMALSVDQIVNWQFSINPKNQIMAKAKKVVESLKKNKKSSIQKEPQKQVIKTQETQSEVFKIEIAPNPYLNAKEQITVFPQKKQEKKKQSKEQLVSSQNKIPFTIICKNPVYEFTTYVLLTNKTKTDVRRYRVIFTIQPKPLKAILQMNVPARSEVTQNLPIVNNTERDWNIKITWQPDMAKNGVYFSINPSYNSSFPVKKNSIGNFPITFKPKWAYKAEARLVMNNPLTLDQFQYDIIGIGEEPLAQEHIQIRCEAKQIVKKQIIVKNPYSQKPITFNVETDLANWKGSKKITIPSGGKEKYQFTVQPMLCGQYTGSISFLEQDGPQYIWYTVSIITNYPQAYKVLDLVSEIREAIFVQLEIPLAIKQPTNFQVIINGQGLNGDPSFKMQPNSKAMYKLQYLPLSVGQQKASICFINPEVGQTLYELNLRCTPKLPIIIKNLKSPLGVSTSVFAQLFNPTNSRVFVKVTNSNPQQFVIKSNSFKLGALEKKSIEIQYVPASLQILQSANIKFSSKDIGDWQYELSGTGQQPVPYPPHVVYNGLYQQHSDSLKFRNPFKYPIVVGIKITGVSEPNIFKLLNHGKDRFDIDAFGILQIPFSFIPTACKLYECKILVMISQKIFWTFPIRGITQINKGTVVAHLSTQCRQSISQSIQIPLQGVQNYSMNNQYSFSLENVPQFYQKLCDKFLNIQCTKNRLAHSKDALQFQFVFKPMKPGKITFDFLISRKEGSRWRYKISLEAVEPQPDDIIEIQSNLLVTSTVSFKLTNWQKASTAYRAKFTSDSAHQFSVQPKEGTLLGFGSKGTNFYVSFTPVQYGKEKKGKLIIQTNDMYWSYILKGSLPKYIPPSNPVRSRISSLKK